jgi:hypothetical protein
MIVTIAENKKKIFVDHVNCIISSNDTLGGLYLGNTFGAQNVEGLQ